MEDERHGWVGSVTAVQQIDPFDTVETCNYEFITSRPVASRAGYIPSVKRSEVSPRQRLPYKQFRNAPQHASKDVGHASVRSVIDRPKLDRVTLVGNVPPIGLGLDMVNASGGEIAAIWRPRERGAGK